MFILITVPIWYKPLRMTFIEPEPVDTVAFREWRDQLKQLLAEKSDTPTRESKGSTSASSSTFSTFYFDPNVVSKGELVQLGFEDYLAERLIRYREKGGKFRSGEDLQKLYGMPPSLYERIKPFAIIEKASPKSDAQPKVTLETNTNKSNAVTFKNFPIPILDINEADTVDFERLKGIGKVLAGRIVRYRNALGGFLNVNQVGEVYGLERHLTDSVGKYFYVSDAKVKQIPINIALESELAGHPYISKKQAAAIVAYRIQNGEFVKLEQLKNVKMVGDSTFKKILPYLKIE